MYIVQCMYIVHKTNYFQKSCSIAINGYLPYWLSVYSTGITCVSYQMSFFSLAKYCTVYILLLTAIFFNIYNKHYNQHTHTIMVFRRTQISYLSGECSFKEQVELFAPDACPSINQSVLYPNSFSSLLMSRQQQTEQFLQTFRLS